MILHRIVIGWAAFLLFSVQPMIAKYILPAFGGGANVWSVALLFFMSVLFLGYLYAYRISEGRKRGNSLLHIGLVSGAAAVMLGLIFFGDGTAPILPAAQHDGLHPTLGILLFLSVSIGLPYFLLTTTSVLVQRWAGDADGIYRLYGASNLGAFAAIICYPFLFELTLPLSVQGWWWSFGFVIYCALLLLLMAQTRRRALVIGDGVVSGVEQPSFLRKLTWLAIAALSAMVLFSGTVFVTKGISAGPFMWLVPLGLFLVSYTITFRNWRISTLQLLLFFVILLIGGLLVTSAVLLVYSFVYEQMISLPSVFWVVIGVLFFVLLFFFLYMHRVLYELRPHPQHLSIYYLWIAAGGMVGGIFVNLIAPLFSDVYVEVWLSFFGLFWLVAFYESLKNLIVSGRLQLPRAMQMKIVFFFVAAFVIAVPLFEFSEKVYKKSVYYNRNFYSTLSVKEVTYDDQVERVLVHGRIIHGRELVSEADRPESGTYYSKWSGVGRALSLIDADKKVAVLGLGAGEIAAYCDEGDSFTFFEIDPAVITVAQRYFSHLSYCPRAEIKEGDARRVLAEEAEQSAPRYDVVVVDVFSDDAIPVHLLTTEAFKLYEEVLSQEGVIALHISNSFLDLSPVAAGLAEVSGKKMIMIVDEGKVGDLSHVGSHWVLLVNEDDQRFNELHQAEDMPMRRIMWTDDFSSLLQVIK